jgi:hypothetical protein
MSGKDKAPASVCSTAGGRTMTGIVAMNYRAPFLRLFSVAKAGSSKPVRASRERLAPP